MPEGNITAQKALTVVLGVVGAILLGFFGWLAVAVIEVRERVVRMDANLGSLLETRTAQSREQSDRNTRRLDRLERTGNDPGENVQ